MTGEAIVEAEGAKRGSPFLNLSSHLADLTCAPHKGAWGQVKARHLPCGAGATDSRGWGC